MNFRDSTQRREVNLDLTPLIDVVFLLLVFFLLTTTFTKPTQSREAVEQVEQAIDVKLAKAQSGTSASPGERLTLFLTENGEVVLNNGDRIAPNDLKARLLEMVEDKDVLVDLKADKRAAHGAVIELLDLVKSAGIEQVNIVIEKQE